ncbi:chromatin assembly factor 1 subunit A-domain-containing protein [Xylaria scruposa]|nr:chromatin assembly factor 1 subunit A-domain-containing protein [Xylaria scruposa]
MPLSPMSPNVQVSQAGAEKRLLDQCIETETTTHRASTDAIDCEDPSALKSHTMSTSAVECQPQSSDVPVVEMGSPPESSPLTEARSITPPLELSSPDITPTKSPSSEITSVEPTQSQATSKLPVSAVAKRKRTTEDKAKERVGKKQKQDEAAAEKTRIAAEKAAEKERKAAEKARAEAEREAVRATKAAEKAKADAAKEAKRLKKQEEESAAKAKKEKQQNLMASFLKKAPGAPSKMGDHSTPMIKVEAASPSKSNREATETKKSAYELNFQPFFIKSGVTMAAPRFEMDDETKEVKLAILDEYIRGERDEFDPKQPFSAAETFNIAFLQQRGVIPPSVKKIMETIHGDDYQNAFGITNTRNESQTEKLFKNAQDLLDDVPMKYLRFYEDVRPAYFGTMTTSMTYHKLRKLSRRPAGRILPLAYDYDSEAEWVEDDGEDLDDAEDEEEDIDGDEEMDDFVDDSEAVPTIIRPGFEADSFPVSTGLCFENRKRLGPSSTVYKYRLEFLLDSLEHHSMIDPFSKEYWPAPVKKVAAVATTSSAQGTITSMLPPAAPRDAKGSTTNAASALDIKDGVPLDILEDFKRALLSDECKDYSKGTVIEVLAKKFTSCTKAQVKTTLDTIAHRVTPNNAPKKSVKIWALLPRVHP